MLPSIGNTQANGPSIPGEDETFEPLDNTQVTSYNDTAPQTTFAKTYDEINSPSMIRQKSVYSTLESKVDIFHAQRETEADALQGLTQCSSPINKECQPLLEGKGDMGYVMINLEPVTLTLEKSAYMPVQTEAVNRADKPTAFNVELTKQVSPAASLRHPVSTFEKSQMQGLGENPSLAVSGPKGIQYLHASSVMCSCLLIWLHFPCFFDAKTFSYKLSITGLALFLPNCTCFLHDKDINPMSYHIVYIFKN